jgi:hypothetical protein
MQLVLQLETPCTVTYRVGAVNNFRFDESPVSLLGRLLEVGATAPTLPREWGDNFNSAPSSSARQLYGWPG